MYVYLVIVKTRLNDVVQSVHKTYELAEEHVRKTWNNPPGDIVWIETHELQG